MNNTKIMGSIWVRALAVAVGWQLLMTLIGFLLDQRYSPDASHITALSHTTNWDGGWFLSIISGDGYRVNGAAPVFYPLFPVAVNTVLFLSFHLLSVTAASLIVNTLATWLAIVALVRITGLVTDKRYGWLAAALFLTSPAAIFLHFLYAEAIFCALAFWAYLFALRRRWVFMAICLSLLAIVKIPAILVILLCGLEFLRAHGWSLRKSTNKNTLSFAIVPIGFLGYGLYLQKIRGDFLGMLHGYHLTNDWAYHVFNPNFVVPIFEAGKTSVLLLLGRVSDDGLAFVNSLLPFAGLALLALTSLYAIMYVRGKMLPLGIAGLASIVFFSINSNVVSVHRYLLPCLILYLVPVVLVTKYKKYALPLVFAVMAAGCLIQAILYSFFVSARFAG